MSIELAAVRLRTWREHPATMVRELFGVTPDGWQEDILEAFPHRRRQAMTACKGPGKSALLSWLIWNFLLTRIEPRVVALSITWDNLQDNLWRETAKWQARAPVLREYFRWGAEKIVYVEKPETWYASARSYSRSADPQAQANSIAGLHEDRALLVLDESGGIPPAVLATAEGILTGGGDQHIVLAGNPTNQNSALGRACIEQRHLWDVTEITGDPDDPKRAKRVDVEWAREQIAAWGRDNPWVLVNVFGRFPPGGLNTLLTPDEVRDAQKRHYTEAQYGGWPRILGVDVARFGDDESVIWKRQGRVAFTPLRMRNLDSIQGASHVARIATEWHAQSIQIDATGGWGAGWYDQLQAMNYAIALPIQFASAAAQDARFHNKRAEMWWEMAEWVKTGGALPPVPEMVAGLSTVTYSYKGGRILIEDKDQIKARLGRSPDLEDGLACTFAFPVALPQEALPGGLATLVQQSHQHDYDPFARAERQFNRE